MAEKEGRLKDMSKNQLEEMVRHLSEDIQDSPISRLVKEAFTEKNIEHVDQDHIITIPRKNEMEAVIYRIGKQCIVSSFTSTTVPLKKVMPF